MIYIKLIRVNNEYFYCVVVIVIVFILNYSKIYLDFLVKIIIFCEDLLLMLGLVIKFE